MLVDTHCHLDAAEFGASQSELVNAANTAGVRHIVVPSVTRDNFAAVKNICAAFPACLPAYGIHPMYTDDAQPEDLKVLRDYLALPGTVAVGEIGLDFFVKLHDRDVQEFFFIRQLELAREFELPVLLHVRSAIDVVLKHLRHFYGSGGPSTSLRTGIAHAFNGSPQQAEEFIKLGFKLGFGGAMTYPRATKLRKLAAILPLDSIVLETDAPDIPPQWLERGQPNKPEYLPRIAQTLAELRGLSIEEIARITTVNASSLFAKNNLLQS